MLLMRVSLWSWYDLQVFGGRGSTYSIIGVSALRSFGRCSSLAHGRMTILVGLDRHGEDFSICCCLIRCVNTCIPICLERREIDLVQKNFIIGGESCWSGRRPSQTNPQFYPSSR